MGESQGSNISQALAPSVPNAAASFSANLLAQHELECQWTHEQGQYIQNTQLYKRVVGVDPDYFLVGTFPLGIYDFIDPDVSEGKKVLYKIVENNYQGSSNPKRDFVIVPFRNVANPTPLRITTGVTCICYYLIDEYVILS
jgi:hypothetical protein